MWVGKKLYRKKKVPNTAAFYVSVSSRSGKKLNPEKKNWILENRRETATTKPCEAG
jgi:hypothetical protein